MKNMKKMLSVLTALSFVTVAGVSTVACNKSSVDDKNDDAMNSQVLLDLGVYDKDGKSQVEVKLDNQNGNITWVANKLDNLTASNLLDDKNKAKSEKSFNFLTDVLKLEAKGDGDWSAKVFEKDKADAISLTVVSIDPTLKAIDDDYAISKGTITVQWKQKDNNLGSQYSISLKIDETKGVVKKSLPASKDLTLKDFDKTKGVLANFDIGKNKSGISEKVDITSNLKTDTEEAKKVLAIAKKANCNLKCNKSLNLS